MTDWTTNRIVAITSILVSVCTLILFLYEINLIRQQQKAAVLPYLSMMNMGAGGNEYQLLLVNDGLGPAFITSVAVVSKGKRFSGDPIGFLQQLPNKPLDSINLVYTNVTEGTIVAVGKPISMISARDHATSVFVLKTLINDSCNVVIEYKSVYGERWKITSNSMVPEELP